MMQKTCHLCPAPRETDRYWSGVLRPLCRPCESQAERGEHPAQQTRNATSSTPKDGHP
jgi:hypothetical protein